MRAPFVFIVVLAGSLFAPTAEAEPRRSPQDYGRPDPETTVADVLLWPLRIVLFPLWVVSELVVRRPLRALLRGVESPWLSQILSSEDPHGNGDFSIVPSLLIDVGLAPSAGFNAHWAHWDTVHNVLDVHFGTWGIDWIESRARDTLRLDRRNDVFMEASFVRRRDLPFFGIGPRSRQDDRARYFASVFETDAGFASQPWRNTTVRVSSGVRSLAFHDGGCCGDPVVVDAPGMRRGYTGLLQRAELGFDSRGDVSRGGSAFEVHEETVLPFDAPRGEARRSWISYGASATVAADLSGHERVVSMTLATDLADPLGRGEIPFTELPSLGGDELLPGFIGRRLVDRSAVAATARYAWPIWPYLQGTIHAGVGNVFGRGFDGFDVAAMRLSTGIGIRSTGPPQSRYELLFAIGTDPLDRGFEVSSVRFLFGSHHGF